MIAWLVVSTSALGKRQAEAPDEGAKALKDQALPPAADLSAQLAAERQERARYGRKLEAALVLCERLSRSVIYRAMRRFGLWSWAAEAIEAVAENQARPERRARPRNRPLRRILVSLVGLRPGGENGGSKIVALSLVRAMSRSWPDVELEVATDAPDDLEAELPAAANLTIRRYGARFDASDADLLFCPLTSIPAGLAADLPVVTIVYDLQHRHYPQFFGDDERAAREADLRRACRMSTAVVCISEFVRSTIVETGYAPPERVVAIPLTLQEDPAGEAVALEPPLGLDAETYLLYPANFWPHKNHEMLLTALGVYFRERPASRLKVVLTGHPCARSQALEKAAQAMGLGERVLFAGDLSRDDLSALLHGAKALVFPSLYEGYGMPVAEALAAGRPALVSDVPALREVAGDAALFFDPRNPQAIAASIAAFEDDTPLAEDLSRRARERARALGRIDDVVSSYREAFDQAAGVARSA